MDVQRPKVATECFLLVDADVLEVLVAEDYDASLSNE